jgi:hypothetical protein
MNVRTRHNILGKPPREETVICPVTLDLLAKSDEFLDGGDVICKWIVAIFSWRCKRRNLRNDGKLTRYSSTSPNGPIGPES